MIDDSASNILKAVPREKAFYFFTSIGNYTGINALSLTEFMEKINEINVKSLEFHSSRGDFEKWIDEVVQDKELAAEMRRVQKSHLAGEALRSQLAILVSRRVKRLVGSPTFF